MLIISKSHYLLGRDCCYVQYGYYCRVWLENKQILSRQNDWILLVKYWSLKKKILVGVYRSDMLLTVQVQSCVFCSSDIRLSPAQREAELWDKEAAYQQKYQLLHTASWCLMGLLWWRDAQDERLLSSFTVKPASQPSPSCLKTTGIMVLNNLMFMLGWFICICIFIAHCPARIQPQYTTDASFKQQHLLLDKDLNLDELCRFNTFTQKSEAKHDKHAMGPYLLFEICQA